MDFTRPPASDLPPEPKVRYSYNPRGEPGPQGDVGPQGRPGIQGDRGVQGLKGDKGDKGDIGNTGPQGAQGIQGVQGLKGDKGDKGLSGDLAPATTNTWSGSASLGAWDVPSTHVRTLTGNFTITELPSPPPAGYSGTITLVIKQAATGGPFAVTWPSTLKWANDAPAPVTPQSANAELVVHLFWTGVAWRGFAGGVFFP